MNPYFHSGLVLALGVAGCGSGAKSDADFKAEIIAKMHDLVLADVQSLNQASRDAQAAAPLPPDRGWDATADQMAIDQMKAAWGRMRTAWEQMEGVLEPAFPDLDAALDSRYDELLAALAPAGDVDLFDGQGVIGMHAVERILYAPDTPAAVVAQESQLAGYAPAAWPASADQARELKMGLYAQVTSDSERLVERWMPYAVDLPQSFQGLTRLMSAQAEKVSLAADRQQESRYSQRTMADLRDNLAGTKAIYELFVPWLTSKPNGPAINAEVQTAFDRLSQTYSTVAGDAIPQPPDTWSSTLPSVADQQTPFGQLYLSVVQEVDASRAGSAVDAMNNVARTLGLPEFTATN
jgi:iron uptake system component EfeO